MHEEIIKILENFLIKTFKNSPDKWIDIYKLKFGKFEFSEFSDYMSCKSPINLYIKYKIDKEVIERIWILPKWLACKKIRTEELTELGELLKRNGELKNIEDESKRNEKLLNSLPEKERTILLREYKLKRLNNE